MLSYVCTYTCIFKNTITYENIKNNMFKYINFFIQFFDEILYYFYIRIYSQLVLLVKEYFTI